MLYRLLFNLRNLCCAYDGWVWHIIFSIRYYCGIGFKAFMRLLGPVMIIGANLLFFNIIYNYMFHLLPKMSGDNVMLYFTHFLFGFFLLSNIEFNYMGCIFTPPGHPEPCLDPRRYLGLKINHRQRNLVDHYAFNTTLELEPAVNYRWCKHCKCIKPPRTHHDSITGRCILHMDHYCPWMGNCVGKNNYRYFVLFLIYLFLGCVYILMVSYYVVQLVTIERAPNSVALMYLTNAAVLTFTIGLSAGISVLILLVFHTFLVLTNQTTLEFYINWEERREAKEQGYVFKNPFDKGWRKNLIRVFGDCAWYHYMNMSVRDSVPCDYPALPQEYQSRDLESSGRRTLNHTAPSTSQ